MSTLFCNLNTKQLHFMLQGIRALQTECAAHKAALVQKMFPEDANLLTLVEYYDRRSVELLQLEKKLISDINQ